MDAIYFGDETMFAGLFGTPTRNRGSDSDSVPSSQHAAEQKARGEAWMLYFDAIAVPETAHTRRWAHKVGVAA